MENFMKELELTLVPKEQKEFGQNMEKKEH